jgi:hypothetical protein
MKKSTFECETCEQYIADADLFIVANRKTHERMAFHKACVAKLITQMAPAIRVQRQRKGR